VFLFYLIGSVANEECWMSVVATLSSRELVYQLTSYYYITILLDESKLPALYQAGRYLDTSFWVDQDGQLFAMFQLLR
jgi:hypothetical protein